MGIPLKGVIKQILQITIIQFIILDTGEIVQSNGRAELSTEGSC